jgi:hypothetical protein
MSPHRKISLKVISAVVSAPPVLKASDHTIDYACGNCGTVLLHAEDGQIHNLVLSTAPNAARTIRQTLKAASGSTALHPTVVKHAQPSPPQRMRLPSMASASVLAA